MINSSSQNNLSRTSLYLAAGVGLGIAAVAARQFVLNSARSKNSATPRAQKKGVQGQKD